MECNPRHTEYIYLTQKLPEIDSSFVPHVCRTYKDGPEACTGDSLAHVDVFGEHFAESAYTIVDISGESHVECARCEFLKSHFAATYAAGCEKRGHGIVDCLLGVGETAVGGIRPSEAVAGRFAQLFGKGGEIVGRNHAVGIEKHEPSSACFFHACIAGNGAAFVFLIII